MRDKELYTQILGIRPPWKVSEVKLALEDGEAKVFVEQEVGAEQHCPKCGQACPGYGRRQRSWRYLDTCQFRTILVADVLRIKCPEHGVVTIDVPCSEPGSGFTA